MLRKITILIVFICISSFIFAQSGKISGKIIDGKTGETLPGATILIEGTTKGASADFDGVFSIPSLQPGTYTLVVSYVTYDNKKIGGIQVKANDVTELNIAIEQASSQNLVEVVVQAEMNKENTNTLLVMQKNNASLSDGISSEAIKKTPDRNTSDVLKRVSGASIQDNKFAIIRGLNDRYNAAYINGAPLPSSESDRKAFSFDIFPANLLDNLTINKTATPDMPGEFAGGIIFINTKSIPEKNFQSFSIGGGYNTITTGKDQLYYKGGKTDWLGIDDGTRALPGEIPAQKDFSVKRPDQAKYATYMKNDWGIYNKKFAPNSSFQYAMGHSFKHKDKDVFGMVLALTYNKNFNYTETERNTYQNSTDGSASQQENAYLDKSYSNQTLVGALANFTAKINQNHSISFKNLYSINSDDKVIRRTGATNVMEENKTIVRSTAQWFTSNKIYTGQLIGDHYIPKAKIKLNWVGSYSNIERLIPNLRRNIFTRNENFIDATSPNPQDTMYSANVNAGTVGPDYGGGRFYASNKESIYSFKADINYHFVIAKDFKNDIKIGGTYQERSRVFAARQLGYIKYSSNGSRFNDSLRYLDESQIFATQNLGDYNSNPNFAKNKGGFILKDGTKPTDTYDAKSVLTAGFLMFDNRYKDKIRVIWGVRIESFNQQLNTILDTKDTFHLNTTKVDILPSVNLVYSLTEKQNIRACYSKTLNRPEFRELAPFIFYDFETNFSVFGNPYLQRASITNYDLRYEYYPGRGQLFSVTGFYKDFKNPIEKYYDASTSQMSYTNVPKAKSYGVELEMRVVLGAIFKADSSKFLNNLTVYSNFAYIKSEVDVSSVLGSVNSKRPLQGQSPYIFNAGLMYTDSDLGYSISAAVNRVGQRIAIVGNIYEPDIWENGRNVLDLQASKSLLKNKLEIKLNVRDALAQKQYFFQDANNNQKFDKTKDDKVWITRYGRTISLALSYKF